MSGTTTKQNILEAANKLFSKHGYDNVSMRDIAAMAGITEGAIYRHYEGKAAILTEIMTILKQKTTIILHSLDKKEIDKYIETEPPRQVLGRCKIVFDESDFPFMAHAYSIALQEHLTNPEAQEIVVYQLYMNIAEKIQYIVGRLQELGEIPMFNTKAFSLIWARFGISTLALWVSLSNSGISSAEAEVDYPSILDWLIELALTGKAQ